MGTPSRASGPSSAPSPPRQAGARGDRERRTDPSLSARLDAEWEQLAGSFRAARALRRWAEREPMLASFPDLHWLRATVHDRGTPERSDHLLGALVRLAAVDGGDDQLAARTVLQLLLPGALRLAGTVAAASRDPVDAEAAVLAELMIGIRTFPWRRRRRAIAANLLLDTRQRLFRSRHRTGREVATGLDREAPAGSGTPATELDQDGSVALNHLLRWAQQQRILDRFETTLLVGWHVYEIPVGQLVTRLGRSRSRLFQIRADAERRLREALAGPDAPSAGSDHRAGQRTDGPGRESAVGRRSTDVSS